MDQQISLLNLDDDLKELDALEPDEADRWKIQRVGPVELHLTLSPVSDPTERYLVRLYWPDYPDHPPSVRFVDPATSSVDVTRAWPMITGARPPGDMCVPWSSEGQSIHTEWHTDPNFRWDGRGNPLLRILRTLQDLLDHEYSGRAA